MSLNSLRAARFGDLEEVGNTTPTKHTLLSLSLYQVDIIVVMKPHGQPR